MHTVVSGSDDSGWSRSPPSVTLACTVERLGVDRPVHQLVADPAWRAVIEPITRLKQRLDVVLNARAWQAGEVGEHELTWCRDAGFPCDEAPGGDGVCPNAFVQWIAGPFREPADKRRCDLTRVPSWAAIGWRRRRQRAADATDAQQRRASIDADTITGHDGKGLWLRPSPLVVCSEGKHRVEMHTEYFDDLLVNVNTYSLPDAGRLRLKRGGRRPPASGPAVPQRRRGLAHRPPPVCRAVATSVCCAGRRPRSRVVARSAVVRPSEGNRAPAVDKAPPFPAAPRIAAVAAAHHATEVQVRLRFAKRLQRACMAPGKLRWAHYPPTPAPPVSGEALSIETSFQNAQAGSRTRASRFPQAHSVAWRC